MKKTVLILLMLSMILSVLSGCHANEDTPDLTEPDSSATTADPAETKGPETEKEDPSMISHWTFDEIGENGLVEDLSGRKNGTAKDCLVSDDAIAGKSLLFQPSKGAAVTFGTQITDALRQTGAITVAFWYYSTTPYLQRPYVFYLSMEDGKPGISVEIHDVKIVVNCRSHMKESMRTKEFPCRGWADWKHLALTVDYKNETVRLYSNGIEIPANEGSSVRFGHNDYRPGTPKYEDSIGGFSGDHFNTKVLTGKIDEVYLFSKAADADEIKALYSEGRNVTTESDRERTLFSKLSILTSTFNTVLANNSNMVLSDGDRCYLVPGDASAKVFEKGGNYYAPVEFYNTYCKNKLTEIPESTVISQNGYRYVSVKDYAALTDSLYTVTEKGSIIIGKKSTSAEEDLKTFIDRYYAGEIDCLPMPEEDFYSSRAEVAFSDVASNGISLGSPCLLRLPNGNLLASYDYNGKNYRPVGEGIHDVGVNLSTDDGKTWKQIAIVPNLLWATMFRIESNLYLIGKDTSTGKLAIVRSTDSGYSWTASIMGQIDTRVGSAHHAPTPAVISNGRVYIAFEDAQDEFGQFGGVPSYRAYMMSAPVDSDLLSASSWTKSNYVSFDPSTVDPSGYYGSSYTGFGFYEGNAVKGPDGKMYVFLRMDADPSYGLATVLKLSDDNTKLEFHKIVHLPVAKEKYVIRYDEQSKNYIAIGNRKTTDCFPSQRNVLAMYYSPDLENWTYGCTLIADNSIDMLENVMHCYGYQYPDFLIDGDRIIMLVREASGNTKYFHNANYITFYTVDHFRDYIK